MRLLPDNSHAESDGALSIGGCRIDSLASQYGTPLFVYDETHIRSRAREAVAEFGSDRVIYATKAFLCTAMARLIHEEGLLLDVATGGELFTALRAGVPASRCVMHGNNKSIEELRYAMSEGVRHIVVDSFDEIDRIEALHRTGLPAPRVQLRITPGVHVHTHEFVQTGQDDSKFGFNLNNGDAHRAIERVRACTAIDLVGIHCHIGSNVFDAENFAKASEVMVNLFATLDLPELTLGGGSALRTPKQKLHRPSLNGHQFCEVQLLRCLQAPSSWLSQVVALSLRVRSRSTPSVLSSQSQAFARMSQLMVA